MKMKADALFLRGERKRECCVMCVKGKVSVFIYFLRSLSFHFNRDS